MSPENFAKNSNDTEETILSRGQEIFSLSADDNSSIFNKDWWYGRIMEWSMKNEAFKVQMFRFVDVLPYLSSSDEVARHLKEYFAQGGQDVPSVLGWGLGLGSLAPGLLASSVKKNVSQMARMFITGENPDEAFKNIETMRKKKLTFTVDILGEAALSETEAVTYQKRYLELIETLASRAQSWPEVEQIDRDHLGAISKVNVSVKISSLYSQIDPLDTEGSIKAVNERLRPIFRRAKELGVFINLDMESYVLKDLTLALFKSLMSEPEFASHGNVGIVIQAYLRDSERDLRELVAWAQKRVKESRVKESRVKDSSQNRITVRLVKGAYWDYETVLAEQRGWPVPVFTDKKETDANYETLTLIMLENDKYIKSAFGSHNIRSVANALVQADRLGVDRKSFEIQMLYGMADSIKQALVKMNYRVREYAPVGELIPGMAYLVRRLLENTSNEGFLRAKFASNIPIQDLMKNPKSSFPNATGVHHPPPKTKFFNEPPTDFNIPANRVAMTRALEVVRKQLGKKYHLQIGKKQVKTDREMQSVNPANPSQVIGSTAVATTQDADFAIQTALKAQKTWAATDVNERCQIFERAAELMRQKKFELCALEVFEVGKTWREADGDVAEAIDFCVYYAQQMRKLARGLKTSFVAGEESRYEYHPRGVGVVIAPWNFPLAILCGMTVGAAISGNAVVMKPAEQSPVIAAWFMDILSEAGLPPGVVNFLPGYGEEVGSYLVKSPQVDFVVFTGSKDVGLQIVAAASQTPAGQKSVKKVVAEMGGKNAIIIDSDADLDEAVLATLQSAFGFQGQKCSACSRAIVLEENYDKFVGRLIEAARSLKVGAPESPSTAVGPVIDKEAYDRILKTIENAKGEARIAFQSEVPSGGYFIPPTIFVDVKAESSLAQKEIFGPVLAVIKVRDFDQALRVANGTEFALTGGVFTRSPANLEQAKREFEVGNLYINRGITGALVGRHPFGGFKMSGMGSKAGGPDYLQQFMEPRTVTENTLRRGFAPPPETLEN